MFDKIMMSVIYILTLGGISGALFAYSYKQASVHKTKINSPDVGKKALIKKRISIVAGVFFAVSCFLGICSIWFPSIPFSRYFYIVVPIAMAAFFVFMLFYAGISRAEGVKVGSATGLLEGLGIKSPEKEQPDKKTNGKLVRRSEDEIFEIKERIKKSAYNPTMPVGVFIICSLVVYYGATGIWLFGIPLFAFALTYVFQIMTGRSFAKKPSFKICSNCFNKDHIGRKE